MRLDHRGDLRAAQEAGDAHGLVPAAGPGLGASPSGSPAPSRRSNPVAACRSGASTFSASAAFTAGAAGCRCGRACAVETQSEDGESGEDRGLHAGGLVGCPNRRSAFPHDCVGNGADRRIGVARFRARSRPFCDGFATDGSAPPLGVPAAAAARGAGGRPGAGAEPVRGRGGRRRRRWPTRSQIEARTAPLPATLP